MIYGLLVFTKARENFICILDTRIVRAFLVVDNDNNDSKQQQNYDKDDSILLTGKFINWH